jgi:hypothetical protein
MPVPTLREIRDPVTDILVDADITPRVARRFAHYLSRQEPGTEVRHEPTGWRFRVDQVDEEKAAPTADATPCST